MTKLRFLNFNRRHSGQAITSNQNDVVVFASNPYGYHNLVLVDLDRMEAFAHGNIAVAEFCRDHFPAKAYRRVRRFLAARGIGRDWDWSQDIEDSPIVPMDYSFNTFDDGEN